MTGTSARTWATRATLALLALIAVAALLMAIALRDNPARPALGERRITPSGEAEIHYFVSGPAGFVSGPAGFASGPAGIVSGPAGIVSGPATDTPSVVLIPSYARSASDFNELVDTLSAAGHRTIGFQPRGIDGSTLPSFDVDLHTYAADLLAVLDAEGSQAPVIVGHAYGNRIARTFASDHPERVASLVLLAAGGERPTPPATTKAISRALFDIWPEATRREAVHFAFFAEGNVVPDYWMRGWYPLAGLAQANAMTTTPIDEWSAGGNAPILVLQPAEDAAAGGGGETLRARFPDRVEVIRVDGAGHALLPEQPDQVSRAVLARVQAAR